MSSSGAEMQPSFTGYSIGQALALNFCSSHTSPIRVRISELCTRTLSCTMVVDIVDNGGTTLPPRAFLKLYDRRFADQIRRDNGTEEWSADLEKAYRQVVPDGTVAKFLHKLHTIPGFEDDDNEPDWDEVDMEAYVDDELFKLFTAVVAAYNALRHLQGKSVPELFAAINTSLDQEDDCAGKTEGANSLDFDPLQVKGVLLQYIEGYTLRQMPDHCPRSDWQGIVDQAVEVVRLMDNILNRDVRPDNFMVSPSKDGRVGEQPYHVFMIDFVLCRVRGEDEPIEEWGKEKSTKDEDGAVGLVMQLILKRDYGFGIEYERVEKWDEWGDTDEGIPEGLVRVEVAPGSWAYVLPEAAGRVRSGPEDTGQDQA